MTHPGRRRGHRCCLALVVFGFTWVSRSAVAESSGDTLTADAIVAKVLERNALGFDNAVARLQLVTRTKNGGDKSRVVEVRSLRRGVQGKTLARFLSPGEVAGTAFLVLENRDRDDDQYLYLPALGKVKRITVTQRQQRFMGTELTYADLESANLRRANLTRLADQSVAAQPTFVVEARPREPKESDYARSVAYVHQTAFVPVRVEFFDKANVLLKVLTVAKLEQRAGRWVATDTSVKNVQTQGVTRLVVEVLDLVTIPDEREFTEQALLGG